MNRNKWMNRKANLAGALAAAALGWICVGGGSVALAQAPAANLSPDLQEVVKLSQQKMSDDIITSYIKNSGKKYSLSADDIIYLNGQGVSQTVINTLLQNAVPGGGNTAAETAAPGAPANPASAPAPTGNGTAAAEPPPLDPSASPDSASAAPSTPQPGAEPTPAPAPDSGAPTAIPSAAPMAMSAPAPSGMQDNFFADGGLNPTLWITQSSILSGIASMTGRPVWTALSFSPSGLEMSGVRAPGQFMGIQSMGSFMAPFNFSATVTGLAQSAIPFEVYLVSADLQQWVSVAGHLGGRGGPRGGVDVGGGYGHIFGAVRIPLGEGRSPEYGVWVNHTGSGLPIASLGYKIFEDPQAGMPYTIQISVGPDGGASVSLLDGGRGLIAQQNVLVGTGPFYIVLAGRDGQTYACWQSVQLVSTAPAPVVAAAPAVPPVPTMDYFQSQLAPYGTWFNSPDYGMVWQPAVGPTWRPYVDGGSWTYTDAGWYWQSDYPWGDMAFHYGRWTYSPTGWIWVPGFDYAPAWVAWRHDDADGYVGWAPLPPGAIFVDGGWRYHGARVGADFDFGIGAGFFCFVDGGHFWDHDFRRYAVPHDRLVFVFGHSAFENRFRYEHGHFMNEGMERDRMVRLTHQDFRARPLVEIRLGEEHRNVEIRHEDVHNFRPGERPDARGHEVRDARGNDMRGGGHPEVRGNDFHGSERPDARGAGHPEVRGATPAGHGATESHAAPTGGGQKSSPQGGAKGGGSGSNEKGPK